MPRSYDELARYSRDENSFPPYRCVIRDFGNGELEVLTHLVTRQPELHRDDRTDAEAGYRVPPQKRPGKAKQDESSLERSCRRARQSVRHRIKAQSLDHMLTLTIRENLQDLQKLGAIWARFLRMVKEKSGGKEMPYVAVVEHQERGALHIHAAVKGRQDVHKLRGLWWKSLGAVVKWRRGVPECIDGETPGNIDVSSPSRSKRWRSRNLATYLSKYITKAMELVPAGKKRYWSPKGVVIPKEVYYLNCRTLTEAMIITASICDEIIGYFLSPYRSPDWTCLFCST